MLPLWSETINMISKQWIGKDPKGNDASLIHVLCWNSPDGDKRNHKHPESVLLPRRDARELARTVMVRANVLIPCMMGLPTNRITELEILFYQTRYRMPSSGMWHGVAHVRTDVSEERMVSIIRVRRIGELGTTSAVTGNWNTLRRNTKYFAFLRSVLQLLLTAKLVPSSTILVSLMMEVIRSSETLILTKVTRRNIREGGILHSHRGENLKSYKQGTDSL
jgi:hypothetical protein